ATQAADKALKNVKTAEDGATRATQNAKTAEEITKRLTAENEETAQRLNSLAGLQAAIQSQKDIEDSAANDVKNDKKFMDELLRSKVIAKGSSPEGAGRNFNDDITLSQAGVFLVTAYGEFYTTGAGGAGNLGVRIVIQIDGRIVTENQEYH